LQPPHCRAQTRPLSYRLRTLACLGLLLLWLASGAAASPSQLRLGVLGSPSRFDAQTGQRSTTRLIIAGWNQGTSAQYFTNLLASMLDEPMIGLSTGSEGGPEFLSPAEIAQGRGDQLLVALNQAIAARSGRVFVRPLAEMNGHWNAYSAFDSNGSARGPDQSAEMFRKAFARIYLVVHGSPSTNGRLRALGLPPVAGGPLRRAANAEVVWNPQGYGSPDLPGNGAASYYPGDAYVDVVADDLYDIGGKVEWAAAEKLYDAHPGKPFAFGEWGLWGIDDPSFVREMASFLRTHRRTILATYYSGRAGSVFDLASKPRSLAAYRSLIAPLAR
jgi:hypothetical protein